MKLLHYSLATWFGCGMSPKAPGTFGSLGALPFICLIVWLGFANPLIQTQTFQLNALFLIAWIIFFLAIPSVSWVIRDSGMKDPQLVVIDEVAGQTLAFSMVSPQVLQEKPHVFLIGFVLFRFFDVLKPLGIHRLERFPGAWGVMLDDMLGGVYASIVLCLIVDIF